MLRKVLKVGDKIELKSVNHPKSSDGQAKVYKSQVLDILDDYRMNIAVPIESGHFVPLEVGATYEMSFLTISGLFMCKCEIKNRLKQDNLYYLSVLVISELKRDQRRQYFRLEKVMRLKYRVISELEVRLRYFMEKKAYKDDREKRIVSEKHEHGTVIYVSFSLDEGIDIEAEARIIGVAEVENVRGRTEYRCEFSKIKKEIREKIVRYVFSEERRQRQKENGL